MHVLYDTRSVNPLDRYEYARMGAAAELAPVAIHGRAPGQLLAVMSVAQIGDFKIEAVTWSADSQIVADRTDRLIRACDPECYRVFLSVNGGVRMEQASNQASFRARDIALYDLSRPWRATHTTGSVSMQVIMLTFPRTLVPITRTAVTPLVGTVLPRNLPGRSLIAQLLIGLTETAGSGEQPGGPDLAVALRECTVGLIRQRLGQPGGISPHTRRLLHVARIHAIMRWHLDDPTLNPKRIAELANVSPRYLHKLLQNTGLTPMRLLKQLRLEACLQRLRDPSQAMTPIKSIMTTGGYLRPDQFAQDFKQHFGVSPAQVRRLGVQRPPAPSEAVDRSN